MAACKPSDEAAEAQAAEEAVEAQVAEEVARQQAAAQAESTPDAAGIGVGALAPDGPPAAVQPAPGGADRVITTPSFSYAIPSDWTTPPPSEFFASMAQGPGTETQPPRVSVFSEPFTGTGAEYGLRVAASTRLSWPVNSEREVALGALTGLELDISMPTYERHEIKRLTAVGGTGYSITCSAQETEWAAVRPTCERIVASFRVTP